METWKSVVGYEGLYEISDQGRVKSLARIVYGKRQKTLYEKILCPVKFTAGYLGVQLCKEQKPKRHTIHRLVCTAFIPNPENKEHIDHKDHDRTNNNLSNLRWVTNLENQRHSAWKRKGLLNKSSTIVVHKHYGLFLSVQEAADMCNVRQQAMSAMLSGKYKNKTPFIYA